MVWLMGLILALAAAVLWLNWLGKRLPETHRVERSRAITGVTTGRLFHLVSALDEQVSWRDDLKSVERLEPTAAGNPVFRESYRGGQSVIVEVLEEARPGRTVRELRDVKGPFRGRWEISLAPEGDGVRVTIVELGSISNLIARVFTHYLIGEATFVIRYLDALQTHVRSTG